MSENILGIDLGTIDSCAALLRNGKCETVLDVNGDRVIASEIVYKTDEKKFLYGNDARTNSIEYAETTMFESKRLLGYKYDNPKVRKDIIHWPVKIVKDQVTGKPQYVIGNEKYFPEKVSSMLLQHIKEYSTVFNGHNEIKNIIITVPAHFNIFQRKATEEAVRLAGFELIKMINEPTAAAIAYRDILPHDKELKVLVFDIGGGTFDVSILRIYKNEYEVLSSSGLSHLGGEDFNQILIDYFIKKARENPDFKDANFEKPRIKKKLRKEIENKKKELSREDSASFFIESLYNDKDFQISITRKQYEDLCIDEWKKMFTTIDEALNIAHLKKNDINKIILVGGPTRTPKIKEMILEHFKDSLKMEDLLQQKNVSEVVAIGAAMSGSQELTIKDETSKSIGVKVENEKICPIIPIGRCLSIDGKIIRYTREFKFKGKNSSYKIEIYEGNGVELKENELIGELMITFNDNKEQKVKIEMSIDYNGILNVEALVNDKKNNNVEITMKSYE